MRYQCNTAGSLGHVFHDSLFIFLKTVLFLGLLLSCCTLPKITRQHLSPVKKNIILHSEAFNRRVSLAEELVLDDQIAWITSDSLSALDTLLLDSLDETWFVVLFNDKRSVFYGRYDPETNRYLPKYAFSAYGTESPHRIPLEITEPIHIYARAVTTGVIHFKTILDSLGFDVSYNHYIRQNNDSTFTMWFFPAGYNNYCAQGLDVMLTISADGANVDNQIIYGKFIRYFELNTPEKNVNLKNTYDTLPSTGNLFFALNNRDYFNEISIICEDATYTTTFDLSDQHWIWKQTPDSTAAENVKKVNE